MSQENNYLYICGSDFLEVKYFERKRNGNNQEMEISIVVIYVKCIFRKVEN